MPRSRSRSPERKRKHEHRHHDRKDKREKKEKKTKRSKTEDRHTHDYYLKAPEFRSYLLQEKGLYIEDLETEEAKQHFERFVKKWNEGKLREKYYRGIAPETLESNTRTHYSWNFAKKVDSIQLGTMRDEINRDTNEKTWTQDTKMRAPSSSSSAHSQTSVSPSVNLSSLPSSSSFPAASSSSSSSIGPQFRTTRSVAEEDMDEEDRARVHAAERKKDMQRYQSHKAMVEEELVPKKEGKEAQREKKRMKSAYSRNERDVDVEIGESDLMGTSGDSEFQRMLARQKERDAKKRLERQQHADKVREEYMKKEEDKLAPFRLLVESGAIPLKQFSSGGVQPPTT